MKNSIKKMFAIVLAVCIATMVMPLANVQAASSSSSGPVPALNAVSPNHIHNFHDGVCLTCHYVCPHANLWTEKGDGRIHYLHCSLCGTRMEQECTYDGHDHCIVCGHERVYYYNPCWYWPYYYYCTAANEVNTYRASGLALPANVVTMNVNGVNADVGAVAAGAKDTANHNLLANTLLAGFGFKSITPLNTYKLMPYTTPVANGVSTSITWNYTGLTAGDTAFAIYWNPRLGAQALPVTVWPTGAATFVVPDMNGSVVTLVKCVK